VNETVSVSKFDDIEALAQRCSDAVAALLIQAVQDFGEASVALAGGSTPLRMYEILAEQHQHTVPWQSVHFFWSDERCVPPDDTASNYANAQRVLLAWIPCWQEKVHRLRGEEIPQQEAQRYSRRLGELFADQLGEGEISFDLVLLGMGADGHTASIFPGDQTALAATEPCVAVDGSKGSPAVPRLTLTLPVINNAKQVFVLAAGAEKHPVFREVMQGGTSMSSPIALVRPISGSMHWWVDKAAFGE
jgi:6-phosphogluconolactonase